MVAVKWANQPMLNGKVRFQWAYRNAYAKLLINSLLLKLWPNLEKSTFTTHLHGSK